MTIKYLLPCACGERLAVDSTQAGLELKCRCGAALVVPTLRGLSQLERAPDVPTARAHAWGPREGAVYFVACLTVLAALTAWYCHRESGRHEMFIRHEVVREIVGQMTPGNLMHDWRQFKSGIDKTPDPQVEAMTSTHRGWQTATQVSTVAAVVLLLFTIAGLVWIGLARQAVRG
ncbi:MAG: hypothetical protein K1X74_05610 [Pirellulales bacterium]|nr:hypothetical protein [Pirellulales bacterium]